MATIQEGLPSVFKYSWLKTRMVCSIHCDNMILVAVLVVVHAPEGFERRRSASVVGDCCASDSSMIFSGFREARVLWRRSFGSRRPRQADLQVTADKVSITFEVPALGSRWGVLVGAALPRELRVRRLRLAMSSEHDPFGTETSSLPGPKSEVLHWEFGRNSASYPMMAGRNSGVVPVRRRCRWDYDAWWCAPTGVR